MSGETVVEFMREGGEIVTLGNGEYDKMLHLLKGSLGLGIGPTSFESSAVLGGNGSILRGKRIDERDIFVPVLIEGDTEDDVNNEREHLRRVFSPLDPRPLWVLVYVAGRDSYRAMRIHYKDGLSGNFQDNYGGTWQVVGLEFRAFDALWQGPEAAFSRQVVTTTQHFLSTTQGFLPMLVSGSTIAGRLSAFVEGDAPVAPLWKITPPGSDLSITHVQTGSVFAISGTLTEETFINMATGQVYSATFPNGELWDRVSAASAPFELLPGDNDFDITFTGATSASAVSVSYRPQYLGGH